MKQYILGSPIDSVPLVEAVYNKPKRTFRGGLFMTLVIIVWTTFSLLAGCSYPLNRSSPTPARSTETINTVNLETVRAFFQDLNEKPYTINPGERTLTEEENHVFQWVIAAISEAPHRRNYEIRELRLSKTTPGSESAYTLTRHTAQGFPELIPGRSYIQLHAVHMASDPELHGVIDLQGPTLLSFWADGA